MKIENTKKADEKKKNVKIQKNYKWWVREKKLKARKSRNNDEEKTENVKKRKKTVINNENIFPLLLEIIFNILQWEENINNENKKNLKWEKRERSMNNDIEKKAKKRK